MIGQALLFLSTLSVGFCAIVPAPGSSPFWSNSNAIDTLIKIQAGDSVQFVGGYGLHNIFIAKDSEIAGAKQAFKRCDTNAILQTWNPASCSCPITPPPDVVPPIFFEGCVQVREALQAGRTYVGTQGQEICGQGTAGNAASFLIYANILSFPFPGTYYVVCPAGNHCAQGGQKIEIVVLPRKGDGAPTTYELPFKENRGIWGFFTYSDMTVEVGDRVTFYYDPGFHNLFYSQNLVPLIGNSVSISNPPTDLDRQTLCNAAEGTIAYTYVGGVTQGTDMSTGQYIRSFIRFDSPGLYFVKCSFVGHCQTGMGFFVKVLPKNSFK